MSRAGSIFFRRYVSSPEIIPIKPSHMNHVPRLLSKAQSAVYRLSPGYSGTRPRHLPERHAAVPRGLVKTPEGN